MAIAPPSLIKPPGPRATLVMTVRERHRLTQLAIESILANTAVACRFIFAHGPLPAWLDDAVAGFERAGRLESRRLDAAFWPQEMRARVIDTIDTEFVVFVDNDILVSPGWLERLIACADATGAGAVGPLYLWGDGAKPPVIHMAGGMLKESTEAGGRVLEELHRHLDADPMKVAAQLTRGRCDYLEFHCMLVRTALAREAAVLDPEIRCVHEHIDLALTLRSQGRETWFEPSASVNYLAKVPHVLEDLPLLRQRWDLAAMEASIAAFCRKWNVIPDDRSFGGVRGYVYDLRTRNDPLRLDAARLDSLLEAGELAQTRSALMDLALANGYAPLEAANLGRTCQLAASFFDGGYRPCGRPFIEHAIGTASVLVRYGFLPEIVAAGLLHSAYTHSRLPVAEVGTLLASFHPRVEARVRDYTRRAGRPMAAANATAIRDAEIAAIESANEIDMRLSGEYDYSGRPAEIDAAQARRLGEFLRLLGVPGMAASLEAALSQARSVPAELVTGIHLSYRIGTGNTLTQMARAVSLSDQAPALISPQQKRGGA